MLYFLLNIYIRVRFLTNNNNAFILQHDIVFKCIKGELLNIINKEAELKMEKTLLSKENYLTTDLLNESRKIMQ
ncbi:hypothetical protein BH23THE1_BH23THE1_30280 [soil metagenome]